MTGELQVVERALEATRCAYCDQPRTGTCSACSRSTCAVHHPGPASAFCFQCEADWDRGETRRSVIGLVVMVLAAALAMVAVMVIGTLAGSVGLGTVGSLVVPLPAAAVAHHLVERHHRRAFRPTGALPPATLRP